MSLDFSVVAGGGELDKTFIAEKLKLLANFGVDVVVAGMFCF